MAKVLLDTNVIIDYLSKRNGFFGAAKKIMLACYDGRLDGYITALSIANTVYILRKQMLLEKIKYSLVRMCQFLEIVELDRFQTFEALQDTDFNDFEDCLQYQCATSADVDYIITRDPKGFEHSDIPVLSPEEFCQKFEL